jgi:hypothetical protein
VLYYQSKEKKMPQAQKMSLHDKLAIDMQCIELKKQGKIEEAENLSRTIPLPPYLAKFLKDHLGLEEVEKAGWNLSEAVDEYGSGFLSK